jgi:hypothetical protein
VPGHLPGGGGESPLQGVPMKLSGNHPIGRDTLDGMMPDGQHPDEGAVPV